MLNDQVTQNIEDPIVDTCMEADSQTSSNDHQPGTNASPCCTSRAKIPESKAVFSTGSHGLAPALVPLLEISSSGLSSLPKRPDWVKVQPASTPPTVQKKGTGTPYTSTSLDTSLESAIDSVPSRGLNVIPLCRVLTKVLRPTNSHRNVGGPQVVQTDIKLDQSPDTTHSPSAILHESVCIAHNILPEPTLPGHIPQDDDTVFALEARLHEATTENAKLAAKMEKIVRGAQSSEKQENTQQTMRLKAEEEARHTNERLIRSIAREKGLNTRLERSFAREVELVKTLQQLGKDEAAKDLKVLDLQREIAALRSSAVRDTELMKANTELLTQVHEKENSLVKAQYANEVLAKKVNQLKSTVSVCNAEIASLRLENRHKQAELDDKNDQVQQAVSLLTGKKRKRLD